MSPMQQVELVRMMRAQLTRLAQSLAKTRLTAQQRAAMREAIYKMMDTGVGVIERIDGRSGQT